MPSLKPVSPTQANGRLFWVDDFLPPDQCEAIHHELQAAFWQPSLLWKGAGTPQERHELSPRRVSMSTFEEWFSPRLQAAIVDVEERLATFIPCVSQYREKWQATIYREGGKFDYHLDSTYLPDDPAGERVQSVLIYVQAPDRGGETNFPHLNIDVPSKRGRLLVWNNLTSNNEPDWEMLHAGAPVTSGGKEILVTWTRQRKPQRRTP